MTPYQFLLFDADGTLFDYDRAESDALRQTFEQFGIAWQPEFLTIYRQINADIWKQLERGQITPQTLSVERFNRLLQTLPSSVPPFSPAFSEDPQNTEGRKWGEGSITASATAGFSAAEVSGAYLQNLGACTTLIDGAHELLAALAPHYHLAILTNGLKDVQRARLARSSIRPYIPDHAIIISEEVGAAKPHRAFFDAAFERLGQPPKSTALMIGDSLSSDIQGAAVYGLDTCWFNLAGQPRPAGLPITFEIRRLNELMQIL